MTNESSKAKLTHKKTKNKKLSHEDLRKISAGLELKGGSLAARKAALKRRENVLALYDKKDIHAKDSTGKNLLYYAVIAGAKDSVQNLIDLGAEINIPTGKYGQTLLHDAAEHNRPEIIQLLINKGANVNAQTSNNKYTPLDFAEDIESKEVLLKNNAKTSADLASENALKVGSDTIKSLPKSNPAKSRSTPQKDIPAPPDAVKPKSINDHIPTPPSAVTKKIKVNNVQIPPPPEAVRKRAAAKNIPPAPLAANKNPKKVTKEPNSPAVTPPDSGSSAQQPFMPKSGLSDAELITLGLMPVSQAVKILPALKEGTQILSFKSSEEAQEFVKKVYGSMEVKIAASASSGRFDVPLNSEEVASMKMQASENKQWSPEPKIAAVSTSAPPIAASASISEVPIASVAKATTRSQQSLSPLPHQQYALLATTTPGIFIQVPVIKPDQYRKNLNSEMDAFLAQEKDKFFAMQVQKNPDLKDFKDIAEKDRRQFEIYEKSQIARKENLLQQSFIQEEAARTPLGQRRQYLENTIANLKEIQNARDAEYYASVDRAKKEGVPYSNTSVKQLEDLQYKQNPLIFEGHMGIVQGSLIKRAINQNTIDEIKSMTDKGIIEPVKEGAVNVEVGFKRKEEAIEFLQKMAATHDIKGRSGQGKKVYADYKNPGQFIVYITPQEITDVKKSLEAGSSFANKKERGVTNALEVNPPLKAPSPEVLPQEMVAAEQANQPSSLMPPPAATIDINPPTPPASSPSVEAPPQPKGLVTRLVARLFKPKIGTEAKRIGGDESMHAVNPLSNHSPDSERLVSSMKSNTQETSAPPNISPSAVSIGQKGGQENKGISV